MIPRPDLEDAKIIKVNDGLVLSFDKSGDVPLYDVAD